MHIHFRFPCSRIPKECRMERDLEGVKYEKDVEEIDHGLPGHGGPSKSLKSVAEIESRDSVRQANFSISTFNVQMPVA